MTNYMDIFIDRLNEKATREINRIKMECILLQSKKYGGDIVYPKTIKENEK